MGLEYEFNSRQVGRLMGVIITYLELHEGEMDQVKSGKLRADLIEFEELICLD